MASFHFLKRAAGLGAQTCSSTCLGSFEEGHHYLHYLHHNLAPGSDGKVSAYNVGDLGSIPGSGRSPGEGNGNSLQYSCHHPPKKGGLKKYWASLVAQRVVSAYIVEDLGSNPGSGRSPGEGNCNRLQYSCLENPMDWEAWYATVHGVTKSWTQLSDFTYLLKYQEEDTAPPINRKLD